MINGLLCHYEYCTGCHSCELSCRNEHSLPIGQWGIKQVEVGPFQINEDTWEWNYLGVPTQLCDLCEGRVAEGKDPQCVLHCQAKCLEYGPIDELAKSAAEKGNKVAIFLP